jgi:ABC-type antimicrobial peptide transport system permease subunit
MLKSYFITAWRSLLRNKVASAINIGGLTIGLSVGIIILLFVMDRMGANKFNKNYKAIHLVMFNFKKSGTVFTDRMTPFPLGPAIRKEVPAVQTVARTRQTQCLTQYGSKILYQSAMYAESDFFKMMTFPALKGDPIATLTTNNSIVLTESAARRLFGKDEALGKTIVVDSADLLTVGAVIRDVPLNSSVQFDIVLPFARYEQASNEALDWESQAAWTWIQLRPGASLTAVNSQLTRLLSEHVDAKSLHSYAMAYFAYPLDRLELYGSFNNGKPTGGKFYLVLIMAALAVLVLLVACVNFMNLSTAMAERRAREVGLRKVLGASRRVIIGQFLGEALLLALIALVLSIPLAYIILPEFMAFTGQQLTHEFGDAQLWIMLLILGICTGLVSGSYPALYLSRFQPVKVLKRMVSLGWSGMGFRRSLVTFQFVITVFLVIGIIVCFRQIDYVASRPIGFEPSNLLDIPAGGDLPGHFNLFKQQVTAIPGVLNVTASSDNIIRAALSINNLDWPGKLSGQDFIFRRSIVQYDWTRTTGITLLEGRDFSPAFGADSTACLLNQTAVQRMGLKEPVIGTPVGGHTVIGVIKDYVLNDPAGTTPPLIVYLSQNGISHFLLRITNDGQWKDRLAHIEKIAKKLNPHYPFSFHFTNESYQQEFVSAAAIQQLVDIFGGVAIFVSCMGLFGFAGFIVERRKKEISIRKVLGATDGSLWLSLGREFLQPVVLGFLIAVPLGILVMQKLLATMDYRISLSWWIFAVAGAAAFLIALATVSYHGLRAARINPGRSLQAE